MKKRRQQRCILLITHVGMLVLPVRATIPGLDNAVKSISSPAEFAQEVVALYATGAGALAPSVDPTLKIN